MITDQIKISQLAEETQTEILNIQVQEATDKFQSTYQTQPAAMQLKDEEQENYHKKHKHKPDMTVGYSKSLKGCVVHSHTENLNFSPGSSEHFVFHPLRISVL